MLRVINDTAESKLDKENTLSDNQILENIIYGVEFPVIIDIPSEEVQKEIIEEEETLREEVIQEEETTQEAYRADLDTENLNELDKNIVA